MTLSDLYRKKISLSARTKIKGVWEALESGSRKTQKLARVVIHGRDDDSGGGEEQQLFRVNLRKITS